PKKGDGYHQVIYTDNGLGFDMQKVKNKIFGLHQKFHNHIDSKGIGLYLVYNHIRNLGGDINVESAPNEGTTFVISFKA
ncbi:MAG: ATP-binding protein, partial [Leeuwenhoekiella sp.]